MPFTPLPAQVDLPALEHETLQRWAATKVFARTMAEAIEGHIKTIRDGQKGTPFADQFRAAQRH